MRNMDLAYTRRWTATLRWARVALAAAFLLSSVACNMFETQTAPDDVVSTPPSPSPTPPPVDPPTDPAPPAVAAYAVRWNPSPSEGVKAYELSIGDRSGETDRVVNIPVASAQQLSSNVLRYEINLETDRDHFLRLRAYDGTTSSPPSNEIVVRASALIASAAQAAPMAAQASAPSAANAASTSSSTSASGSAAAESGASDAPTTRTLASLDDTLSSLELDGEGAHLVASQALSLDLVSANAGATFAAWVRPAAHDGVRRVLAAVEVDGVDALELAVLGEGSVELLLRDGAGEVAHRSVFPADLVADVWQHLAFVVDPASVGALQLHVDGVELTAATSTSTGLAAAPADGVIRLGAGTTGATFAGGLGHAAVWGRALSADELTLAAELGHALDLRDDAMAAGLAHYWRLGEGAGELELDEAPSGVPVDLEAVSAAGGLLASADGPQALR